MRTIKFRGKSINNNKWYYGYFLVNQFGEYTICGKDFAVAVIPESVGQFIGLVDRHEKEIYRGDIIRILYSEWLSKSADDPRTIEQYLLEDKCITGTVVFNAPEFELDFGVGKYGNPDFSSFNHGKHGWMEIIGNNIDSPELKETS